MRGEDEGPAEELGNKNEEIRNLLSIPIIIDKGSLRKVLRYFFINWTVIIHRRGGANEVMLFVIRRRRRIIPRTSKGNQLWTTNRREITE